MQDIKKLTDWYENLSQDSLKKISEFYSEEVFFKDPIHELKTLEDLMGYFQKMYTKLENPKFIFATTVAQGQNAFLTWDFQFEIGKKVMKIHGASHLQFDSTGKVNFHRDYWDLAEEVYEKIPLFGLLFKGLKMLFG